MKRIQDLKRSQLNHLKPYIPGTPVDEVRRELGLKRVTKMASNENAFGASPKAVEAIRRYAESVYQYPESGCFYLRDALASRLELKPEQLIFGNGSDELITLMYRAFISPGDEVLVASPTFLIYEIAAQIAGAKIVSVPLKNWRYDLEAMKAAVNKRTKLVFFANPDNPSGSYFTKNEFESFMQDLPKDLLIFMDEAYFEFAPKEDFPDVLNWIRKHPILVSRTFSKAYGLAGLRIGYGMADKDMIQALDQVREPFNVNLLAQIGGLAALRDRSHLSLTLRLTHQGKQYLYEEFEKLGIDFVPSATNFVMFRVKEPAKQLARRILMKGIIIRDLGAWDLPGCLRVTVGSCAENERFIRVLKQEMRA
ncbi:MAG: histidinol-phosphate transaminase [Candidatus Omnitrophica bacterium]|nr:histidinol-phosphate transaminase [Candidatus Omnitrophota bacterium]